MDGRKYEPGILKVVAYDSNGKAVSEETKTTAGKFYKIVLEADRQEFSADGNDISFITASIVDKNGNICPTATDHLNFEVSGVGVFKAVCNGDATLEVFNKPTTELFSCKLVTLVQSKKNSGNITLKVKINGLKTRELIIKSKS